MYPRRAHPYPIPPTLPPANSLHHNPLPTTSTAIPNQTMISLPPPQVQQAYHSARSISVSKGNIRYSLQIEQQPIRARMCGFGDKDRRPITPPPCIRLVISDLTTGKEVDFDEVDSTYFVLNVDLWSGDGTHEANVLRHAGGSPSVSISSSTVTSYPPTIDRQPSYLHQSPMTMQQYRDPYGNLMHSATNPQNMYGNSYPQQISPNFYPSQSNTPLNFGSYPNSQPPALRQYMPLAIVSQAPPPPATSGMSTRNLIGSTAVNAFRLNDTKGKPGYWFILQDLSVRTEGSFRLKMNFVDLKSTDGSNTLNTGSAPMLSTIFSDVFQVYSAKKFPGVIESTPLSKAFAAQGIKIPIRKDVPKQPCSQPDGNE